MNRTVIVCLFLGPWAGLAGCAGYCINADGTGPGYDVYTPEPYILVLPGKSASGRDTSQASLVWLPNYSKRYRIHTWNFLAKAEFKFDIENGWLLTGIEDRIDTTTLPAALLDTLEKTIPYMLGGVAEPALYRIVFDEESGSVTGLERTAVTRVHR